MYLNYLFFRFYLSMSVKFLKLFNLSQNYAIVWAIRMLHTPLCGVPIYQKIGIL